jgi:hypothetical protein
MLRIVVLLMASLVLASCAGATGSSALPAASTTAAPPSAPASAEGSVTAVSLVGTWTRTQDCATMLAAFEAAGLAESHAEWIVGNWVGDPAEVDWNPEDICAAARGAEAHSHFFTADGEFGSLDAQGDVVDGGDYAVVDQDTLSFPSHSTEFGYEGQILVDYVVTDDTAEFEVLMQTECDASCLQAHAWALSAFYAADPWTRSE